MDYRVLFFQFHCSSNSYCGVKVFISILVIRSYIKCIILSWFRYWTYVQNIRVSSTSISMGYQKISIKNYIIFSCVQRCYNIVILKIGEKCYRRKNVCSPANNSRRLITITWFLSITMWSCCFVKNSERK